MTFKALTFAAVAAIGALAATAPAMAQDWRGGDYQGGRYEGGYVDYRPQPVSYGEGYGLRDREDRIQVWIDRARDEGRLPGWRAWHAQGELSAIRRDQRAIWSRQGGIGPGQAAWLNGRLDHLASYARESGDSGWNRWIR